MTVWLYENYDYGNRVFSSKGAAMKAAIHDYCHDTIPSIKNLHYNDMAASIADQICGDLTSLIDRNLIEDMCGIIELEVEEDARS